MDSEQNEWCAIDNLSEIEKEKDGYKQQIADLQKQLQLCEDEKKSLISVIDELGKQSSSDLARITELCNKEKELSEQVDSLQKQLVKRECDMTEQSLKLSLKLDAKTQEFSQLEKKISNITDRLDVTLKQLYEEKKKKDELEFEHQEKLNQMREKAEEDSMSFAEERYEMIKYYEKQLEEEKAKTEKYEKRCDEKWADEKERLIDKFTDVHKQLDDEKLYNIKISSTAIEAQLGKDKIIQEKELLNTLLETERIEQQERRVLYDKTVAKLQQLDNERKLLLDQNRKIKDEKVKISQQLTEKDTIISKLKITYEQYYEKVKQAWEKREREFSQSYMALDPSGFVSQF